MTFKADIYQRLLKKSKPKDDCIIWDGTVDWQGYGFVSVNGKLYRLHRVAFWIGSHYETLELLPEHLHVGHLCRNKTCIRADHYTLLTAKENTAQKKADGTYTHGESHHCATITLTTAQAIADSWGSCTSKSRAEQFGVTDHIVYEIDSRRAWPSVVHPNGKPYIGRNTYIPEQKVEFSDADIALVKTRLEECSTPAINGCWVTNVDINRKRPIIRIFGMKKNAGRWAALVATRILKEDALACHSCGNEKCINPDHLRWGTGKENAADKILHGTSGCKLQDYQVFEVHEKRSLNTKLLANQYNISERTICQIKSGKHKQLQRVLLSMSAMS